ncbi:oxidoreductase [Nakamurella endophytica]|uniref:Uncharacterized protein n=1 Tax=Nakamurella endophytica TaxID=1748367 RepID=A0A917T135_9ACTN|nr:oxidoreductase [Nakamurella endophytica]GGM06610.1 hypothetical protein GCM10011594_28360 [Nakamurella endophytica]
MVVRLFGRGRRAGATRADRRVAEEALAEWVAARRGVEAFVEPRTAVSEVSVLLVAHDGEFTRRRIGSPQDAQRWAREHRLPVYDATVVGYPQRMRDFSRRQRILAERAERDRLREPGR